MDGLRLVPWIGLAACAATAVFAFDSSQQCYFLERSGCTSGTPSVLCKEDSIVCDVGWTNAVDFGCGKFGPADQFVERKCYKISGVLTQDCDLPKPHGYEAVGCRSAAGVCCCALTFKVQTPGPGGNMHAANGGVCCDLTPSP
ncbi:MAG: hypothetical protein HRU70_07270 [Phycisphaeraceae bacterium]|nr:MAG: hypothetical protein HRU70_07270 [Phycisphaeraceae bacterium]